MRRVIAILGVLLWFSPAFAGYLPTNTQNVVLHFTMKVGTPSGGVGDGGSIMDFSKNGLNCFLDSTANPATGFPSYGIFINGGSCNTADNNAFLLTNWTICSWFYPYTTADLGTGDGSRLIAGGWNTGSTAIFAMRLHQGRLEVAQNGDSGNQAFTGSVVISTKQWCFGCVTRTVSELKRVYVNGKLDGGGASAAASVAANNGFRFGLFQGGGMQFNGVIGETWLLNRAASPGEIASWYRLGGGRRQSVMP